MVDAMVEEPSCPVDRKNLDKKKELPLSWHASIRFERSKVTILIDLEPFG